MMLLGAAIFAEAQTGNVAGTLTDAVHHNALPGASVRVEGQEFRPPRTNPATIFCKASAWARLRSRPLFRARIRYERRHCRRRQNRFTRSRTSLAAQSSSITVSSDPDLVGQARALNDQKNSINLVNLVAADQIGSFPIRTPPKPSSAFPASVVQRDQGEGRFVLIRGTEPRLSATTINGVRIGTTENTSRQIPLDTIPADLMGAIEVTKVLTPDMEADSIGGRVNLITKRAPATRHLALTLGSGFNTLVGDDIKDYSATYGQRLLNGKLGFIFSGNFYQNNRGSQDVEPAYGANQTLASLDFRDYVLTRTRSGGAGDIGYRFNAGSEIHLRGLRTGIRRFRTPPPPARSGEHQPPGTFAPQPLSRFAPDGAQSGRLEHAARVVAAFLAARAYSNARLNTPYRLESTYRQTGVTFAPNVTSAGFDPENIQANPQNQNLSAFSFIQNAIQNDRGVERNSHRRLRFRGPQSFRNQKRCAAEIRPRRSR